MKGILIKDTYSDNFYHLMIGINVYATTLEGSFRVLSLKNCEDIENGYDLDELSEEYFMTKYSWDNKNTDPYTDDTFESIKLDFKLGFQKALEILGDKKFSEDDIRNGMERVWYWHEDNQDKDCPTLYELIPKHMQSLKQTEWQVEVVMDRIPADLAPDGWDVFPKLDAQGCIILKRVE